MPILPQWRNIWLFPFVSNRVMGVLAPNAEAIVLQAIINVQFVPDRCRCQYV